MNFEVALRFAAVWDVEFRVFMLEFECGFHRFDLWKIIIKGTMKIEMPQIKRCKLE